jgi:hypothetical protein
MIINLWSTPRTGSNWYSAFLLNEYKKINKNTITIHQYLNHFHLISYYKLGYGDWLYEYSKGLYYSTYFYNNLKQSIEYRSICGQRERDENAEEEFRIELFEKHNHSKHPVIFHNHVAPMSIKAYNYLFKKADRNIFLYRENFINQMSSYALAYGTSVWKPSASYETFSNVDVDYAILENLYERIKYWHNLDKTNCEIIKYEDLNFSQNEYALPKKQNLTSSFNQLSKKTQDNILELNDKFSSFAKTL